MDQQPDQARLIAFTSEVVSAYVGHNRVQPSDLPGLITRVYDALAQAGSLGSGEPAKPERPKLTPQEIRRSITPDHLVSFEDGKRYKTLRRHLNLRGLTPQAYREKWGLPGDYPIVSPSYSRQRSELATALGLGQQRRGGLAKASGADALKVEAFEEAAERARGEATPVDAALAGAMTDGGAASEAARTGERPKRARSARAKTRKSERPPAEDA